MTNFSNSLKTRDFSFLKKSFDNALDNHTLKLSDTKDSFYSFTEILMQYKLVEKANPLKKEEKKWYANPIATGKVGQKELAKEIELQSSLTKGDIGNVIDNLVENLPKHLVNGESVQLGEFGTFRISFSSEGVVDKSKFNTKTIQPKVIFTPSVAFKKALEDIQYSQA